MEHETQHTRAIRFRELHDSPRIFVLPNAWDAASARIFEKAGFHAVGTTSAGVAASLGFPDGERVDRETMLAVVGRIASTVSLPVTADMESGFGETVEKVVETAQAVLHAGAVGMNLEDAAGRDRSTLADIGVQVEKIQAVRQAAKSSGIPIVINARTDVYLREVGEPVARLEHTVRRANAYRKAGADCLFVPGVRDPEIIRRLCAEV
ncbi:MAG TPA: isocitrate lyase/phosphoenolpyruvate mutase family protein, partial [Bryobacteraceae bacterium]|nr:isocitrate lyase/phosphoenolpyruvate mutase family protein [Bryobacteraceae bacterium]